MWKEMAVAYHTVQQIQYRQNLYLSYTFSFQNTLMWLVDPLLGNDREVSNNTTTVAK
jgi:hypothetical protein